MKSIKSKIQISMLSVMLVGSVLIGVITALLNASGIDSMMEKTLGPATQMAADVRFSGGWTVIGRLCRRRRLPIFLLSVIRPLRNWFLSGRILPSATAFSIREKWMPTVFHPQDTVMRSKREILY